MVRELRAVARWSDGRVVDASRHEDEAVLMHLHVVAGSLAGLATQSLWVSNGSAPRRWDLISAQLF